MIKSERQAYILHQVNLRNKVLLTDLCEQVRVSNDTIRRDLQELANLGKVIKIHGGALSHSSYNRYLTNREVYACEQKKIIAKKAVSLIENGMFILTGGGSTIIEMAKAIPDNLHATFITGSIPALFEFSSHPNIEIIAIGDRVSKNSRITVGSQAISKIRQFRVDLCLLGVSAINTETGISDSDWDVVQLKKSMIDSAEKLVCLTIAEKINSRQPIQVCELNRIDTLITEISPDDPLLNNYRHAGINVL